MSVHSLEFYRNWLWNMYFIIFLFHRNMSIYSKILLLHVALRYIRCQIKKFICMFITNHLKTMYFTEMFWVLLMVFRFFHEAYKGWVEPSSINTQQERQHIINFINLSFSHSCKIFGFKNRIWEKKKRRHHYPTLATNFIVSFATSSI